MVRISEKSVVTSITRGSAFWTGPACVVVLGILIMPFMIGWSQQSGPAPSCTSFRYAYEYHVPVEAVYSIRSIIKNPAIFITTEQLKVPTIQGQYYLDALLTNFRECK